MLKTTTWLAGAGCRCEVSVVGKEGKTVTALRVQPTTELISRCTGFLGLIPLLPTCPVHAEGFARLMAKKRVDQRSHRAHQLRKQRHYLSITEGMENNTTVSKENLGSDIWVSGRNSVMQEINIVLRRKVGSSRAFRA
jgi:hypothetical protein